MVFEKIVQPPFSWSLQRRGGVGAFIFQTPLTPVSSAGEIRESPERL
jgi:hypothetical protein